MSSNETNEIAMRAIECVQQLAKGRISEPQPQEDSSALKAMVEQVQYELKNAQELIESQQRCIATKNKQIEYATSAPVTTPPAIHSELLLEAARALAPFASLYGRRAVRDHIKPTKGDYARAALTLDKLLSCSAIGPQDRPERYAWYASFVTKPKNRRSGVGKVSHVKAK